MDRPSIIRKMLIDRPVKTQLADYYAMCKSFSWSATRRELAGLPDGGLNIAYEAVDRQARGPRADHVALRFLGQWGRLDISYRQLSHLTNRFANVLLALGVGAGTRLFVLTGRIPELYIAVLGGLKIGAVVSPLFSGWDSEALATRLKLGDGAVLITTQGLYERRVANLRPQLPALRHVLLVGEQGQHTRVPGTHDFTSLMAQASEVFEIATTQACDLALLHFTSGTTGTPKGVLHDHGAVPMYWMTGRHALDLHSTDIFWCTADPGWLPGIAYGMIAPLLHGATCIVDEVEYDAERWWHILNQQHVSVWCTTPTAIRMLMQAGAKLAHRYSYPKLRFIASVGESLHSEAVRWGQEVLGRPIHDNWSQTETGGIMIANLPALDIKPGALGVPLPGVEAAIAHQHSDGTVELLEQPDMQGELVFKRGWPSMLIGYLNDPERYRQRFSADWYLTGDLARRDADGYYWFVGRMEDAIQSAHQLIGTYEVESALMEHPAVAQAAVIGVPTPLTTEWVKAFVTLNEGFEASSTLRLELLSHAGVRLGPEVAPRELTFLPALPHTRNGKIMHRLLRARVQGLPESDLYA